jgi:hypothetical protein
MEKLDPDIIEKFKEAEGNPYHGPLGNRIDHIIREVYPLAFENFEIDWYGYSDATGEYEGSLISSLSRDTIDIGESEAMKSPDYRTAEGQVFEDYWPYIPQTFLFMDDEDIIDEIKTAIADWAVEMQRKKDMAKAAKIKREAKKKAALGKLSKEERKALGL